MPLSEPVKRTPLHHRRYDFHGYEREDGLWDIEGHITDVKSYAFPNQFRGQIKAGEPLHDMWIRLTVDLDFVIRDIEATIEESPYAVCPAIAPNFKKIVGMKIGPGWRMALRRELGGTEGCTHLVEMLGAMATVTFQTLYPALEKRRREQQKAPTDGEATKRPGIIDTCHAYSSDGEIVREQWPEFYSGEE